MKNEQIAFDPDIPLWFRVLNIEDTEFERSKYAGPLSYNSDGKFRLKDLSLLRRIAPDQYEAAAEDVKAFRESAIDHNGTFKKLGSIPTLDMELHPELRYDKKAQDKYFMEHPELKVL